MSRLKGLLRRATSYFGISIHRLKPGNIGSRYRPIGRMDCLIEDLKFRGLECKNILDVGANRCTWSKLASTYYPEVVYDLIEPQLEMKEFLEEFCRHHAGSKYFLRGVGSKEATFTFTVWDDLQGSSFLPERDETLISTGKQREIKVVTIDSLIEAGEIEIPQLIKMDIQGYELEALKGAEKTFGITEVYILEVSLFNFNQKDTPGVSMIIDFMARHGYVVYDFAGFSRRPYDGALAQCDICFVKENGFLRQSHTWG